MYDISSSYMTYLPVSHSIPLTIILRSAFCILRSAKYPSLWRFFTDKISNVNTLLLCCIYQCHVIYINVMFVYVNVMLYTSMLCLHIYQCHVVYINVISKAYTSVLYAVNRVLNVTYRCCLLYIFLAMWHQDQTS